MNMNRFESHICEIKRKPNWTRMQPVERYLTDSKEIIGDNLEHPVQWKQELDTSKLNGKTIRLRFIMKNANLYSFQFQQQKERP